MSSPAGKYPERHGDIQLRPRGVDLRFVWDPFLNGTILANELEIYRESILPSGKEGKAEAPAVMMVLGGGLWHARQYEVEAVRGFKNAVNGITSLTTRRDGSEWKSKAPFKGWEGIGDQIFFMPVEEPMYKRLSPSRQATILPKEVDQMNEYLHQLEPSQGLTIPWVNQVMTSKRPFAYEASGLHVIEPIVNRRADVLLNLRCNAKVDNAVGSPYDRTCCSRYTSGNWSQWALIATSLASSIATVYVSFCGHEPIYHASDTHNRAWAFNLMAPIGLPVAYGFLADRTQLFNKVQKIYQASEFLVICGLILAIGLLTVRKVKEPPTLQEISSNCKEESSASKLILEKPAVPDTFLSPSQVLEWKGWTIAFFILTQYYAAEHEPWIHITSRLCISTQLFFIGYEHTLYLYTTGDYGVHRVATVLVRTNLFTVAVAYQMYSNYLFYHLAPLLSFWFLVTWGTLRFGKELNAKSKFLLGKIVFSAGFVMMFHRNDQPISFIFDVLRLIFRINWDGHDWRGNILIDPFIVYVGMLVALARIARRHLIAGATAKIHNAQLPRSQKLLECAVPYLPLLAIFASVTSLPYFFHTTLSSFVGPEGYDWDVHPYLSPIPVLAYLILRNSTTLLRHHSSKALMWVGMYGVEIWVLGIHAWNSADGRGVLSLGVGWGRKVEGAILGVLMLGGGAWAGKGVDCLTRCIVGGDDGGEGLPVVREQETLSVKELDEKSLLSTRSPHIRFTLLLAFLWFLNLVTG